MGRWWSCIKQPTSEECSMNVLVFSSKDKVGYAMWYPQMGGYSARCVALLDRRWTETPRGSRDGGCFDVLVWHDGEFPFDEDETGPSPARLHHCDPEQFIRFGQIVRQLNEHGRVAVENPNGDSVDRQQA